MNTVTQHKKAVVYLLCVLLATCLSQIVFSQNKQKLKPLDTLVIENIMGMKGKVNAGEYKVTVPQNDLSIMVDDFKIIPAMGLATWIAFTPTSDGAMVMGDII